MPCVAGILFIIRSLTFANPVVDLRALGNRNFLLGCILSFITGVGIFATIFLTPLFLGYVRGYSAWQTGVAIASTGAASLVGVPVYIMLARKFDTRWLMMFGMACFGLSMWSFTLHHARLGRRRNCSCRKSCAVFRRCSSSRPP